MHQSYERQTWELDMGIRLGSGAHFAFIRGGPCDPVLKDPGLEIILGELTLFPLPNPAIDQ